MQNPPSPSRCRTGGPCRREPGAGGLLLCCTRLRLKNNCLALRFEKKKRDKKKGVAKLLMSTSAMHHPRAKRNLPPSLKGVLKCDRTVSRALKRKKKGTKEKRHPKEIKRQRPVTQKTTPGQEGQHGS
jgi:hypothetical protein